MSRHRDPICDECLFNNFGSCDNGYDYYMKVYNPNDCDEFEEDEDCGPNEDELGYDFN